MGDLGAGHSGAEMVGKGRLQGEILKEPDCLYNTRHKGHKGHTGGIGFTGGESGTPDQEKMVV